MTAEHAQETPPEDGIVFAATGAKYIALARRAARTVRHVWPDVAIDLFSDADVGDPVFDRVHRVENASRRPKMEALQRSRFARSIYLDCDIVTVAPAPEVFDLLREFDIAGAHEQFGNAPITQSGGQAGIPVAFRQINSGVLGVRKSARTDAFLRNWQRVFEEEKHEFDQPVLRGLLYRSDLRLAVLPVEYNYMHLGYLANSTKRMMAPRFLHVTRIHVGRDHAADADQPFAPDAFMGERAYEGLQARLSGDRSLGAAPVLRDYASETVRKLPFGRRVMRRLSGRLGWL